MFNTKAFILLLIISFTSLSVTATELEDGFKAFANGDYQRAMQIWLPLAEKDNADAQYNIGILYMKGLGVSENKRTAFNWYKRAAKLGNTDAMYNLGIMYNKGKVMIRSPKDAIKWWTKAAELNNPHAQFNLGVQYAYGRIVRKDTDKAIRLWLSAAQQGHADARAALHQVYKDGLFGIPADQQKARQWK